MQQTIPLKNNLFYYKFQISLSSVIYTMTLRFNGRMNRWILDLADVSGNQIVSGIVLLVGINLLYQYTTLNVLAGALMAIDTSPNYIQPTQFSFGNNNFLVYLT